MSGVARCVWMAGTALGEGPVWDDRESCLWFVDIKQSRLHRFEPLANAATIYDLDGSPSFVLPAAEGGLLIGNGHELVHWRAGQHLVLATIPMRWGDRMNDATVGPDGRVWFGSMDAGERDLTGCVRSFHAGRLRNEGLPAVITNGPAVSGDGRWLFHVDTVERKIWRVPLDADGVAGAAQLFVQIDPADGNPDGVVLDADEHLWVGLWGGWCVRRYAPDGTIADEIGLPCANVTKLAFGGPDLRTAYVTTARTGLGEDAIARQPLAGGLFSFETEVPGRLLPLARLTNSRALPSGLPES